MNNLLFLQKILFILLKVALIKQSTMQHTLSFSIDEKQGKRIFSSFMIDKNKKNMDARQSRPLNHSFLQFFFVADHIFHNNLHVNCSLQYSV